MTEGGIAGSLNAASALVLVPAGDLQRDLVEMPFVTDAAQPTADLVGELLAELTRPLPHGLVADDDAACRQHFLDHAKAGREAEVKPDGVADDLGWKPIAGVAGAGDCRHPTQLSVRTPPCKPRGHQLDGAVWILPNPSGLNRSFTLDALVTAYAELHRALSADEEPCPPTVS